MSKEKQIEDMAKILIDYKNKNHIMASTAILADYAEQLYNAGYRKQSEGEWRRDVIASCYVCSLCKAKVDRYAIVCNSGKLNFCPNCGAKMKGGAE